MKRLKITSKSSIIKIVAIIVLIYALVITLIPKYKSIYNGTETEFECKIIKYKIDGNKLDLNLKCKEKLIGTYFFKTKEELKYYKNNLVLGSTIILTGELSVPKKNTIPYSFNYKKYLYNNKIYYTLNISTIKVKNTEINIFYRIKNSCYKRINTIKNNEYLFAYILGSTNELSAEALNSYRTNGISHLFALSGLHVGVFSLILLKIFKKIKLSLLKSYILVFIFLLLFAFITNFSPSILRASILFFLIGLNKVFNLKIETINLLYLTFIILVLINPFIIYNMSFILSFTSTFFIIFSSDFINDSSYLKGLFKVSFIAFISNIALSVYYFNYISPLGVIMNLLFVPLVSFIIFPLSILTFIFPFLGPILNLTTYCLEKISTFCSSFLVVIYFPHISLPCVIVFYILLVLLLKFRKKFLIILMIILISFWKIKPYLSNKTYIYFIDVGQGDSTLILTPHAKKSILIDTGGVISYNRKDWQKRSKTSSIAEDKIIPLMRNIGINKLDYIILTHGDFDHMGEALKLVENFKVENVIFNCGTYNGLEKELIKTLDKKNIKYYSCIKELNIDKYKLEFLNTKEYDNENDNSNVIYFNTNNYKFLFMGDAGIDKEKDILDKYNIKDIDFLKVGHHGSNTSSSEEFINIINPKVSLISVGNNNRYGHPKKSVLDTLSNSKVYRTDLDGSIEIKLNTNDYKIRTCSP